MVAEIQLPHLHVPPVYVRWPARAIAYVIVLCCELAARWPKRRKSRRRHDEHISAHVLLTGTFLSDNWLRAHVRPLALSSCCRRVIVVSDQPMCILPRVRYVCPPAWLRKIFGRVVSRSMLYVWTALRFRPDVCGGFHLLCNGLLAQATAGLVGARSLYFSVGGRTEIIGGGTYGENSVFGRMGRHDRLLESALLRLVGKMDAVVTMGTGAKHFMRERGVAAPIHVNPGGMNEKNIDGLAESKDIDVVTTCRLAPVKRIDVFLRAAAEIVGAKPDLRVAIVGDGDDREMLKRMAAELGVADNVTFAGYQSNIDPWLRRARLFLLTSDSEGVPLSIMEAMMMGLPCVASDVGDVADMVEDGVNGVLVPRRDHAAFAAAVLMLLEDPQELSRRAGAARRRALQVGVPATALRWDRLLTEALGGEEKASSERRAASGTAGPRVFRRAKRRAG